MAIFDKKVKNSADPEITVSDENASLLPDDKQTISAVNINKTNTILFFSAITMILVFIVVMVVKQTKNYRHITKDKNDNIEDVKVPEKIEQVYIPPVITFDPKEISLKQNVGEDETTTFSISVLNNNIKITDIILNKTIDGLVLDKSDCIKGNISKDSSCSVLVTWTPKSKTNLSVEVVFNYQELDGEKKVSDKTATINLNLEGIQEEEEKEAEKEEPEIKDEPEEEKPKQDVVQTHSKTEESSINLKNLANDCKKYASKAYDFSGTFIGWVQGDNRVYSPNCKEVIGQQEEDGIIKSITGQILGQGTNVDSKLAEEKRIELTLPLLDGIIQNETAKPKNFKNIVSNRRLVKSESSPIPKKDQYGGDGGEDLYHIADKLEIKKGLLKNKVPFSIKDPNQLSSMPKDERYVLRQSKPIPAVLNKAIFLSSATGVSQDITATVERNVFGGDGRTIVIPSGTQLIGVAGASTNGEGAEKTDPGTSSINSVQKINIVWYRLIRPDGAEFNLNAVGNYSADAQGRAGVPGKNDTGYIKQLFVKPLLYSALPVAMEALFPTTSTLVTRAPRLSAGYNSLNSKGKTADEIKEMANDYGYVWNDTEAVRNLTPRDKIKAEVTQNFKSVMNKLIEDSANQMIPFTVPAGTRIQVFLHKDIMLRVNDDVKELLDENKAEGEEGESPVPVGFTGTGVDESNKSVINEETFTTRTGQVEAKKDPEPKESSEEEEDEGGEEDDAGAEAGAEEEAEE